MNHISVDCTPPEISIPLEFDSIIETLNPNSFSIVIGNVGDSCGYNLYLNKGWYTHKFKLRVKRGKIDGKGHLVFFKSADGFYCSGDAVKGCIDYLASRGIKV